MNSHKSRARRRRLAHAASLLRRYWRDSSADRSIFEGYMALRRAGWSPMLPEHANEFLSTRGFNVR